MNNNVGMRVGEVIKALGMKKVRFAEKIGVDQSYMTKLSKGTGQPSDLLITSICREFNVNEKWLRTGEGEMFNQSVENTVDRLCAELHASELESGIIRAYFRIDPRIREPFMQRMIQEMQSEYAASTPVSAESEQSEPAQPVEQKKPTPVSEDGRADWEEVTSKLYQELLPGQKQQILDLKGMIE